MNISLENIFKDEVKEPFFYNFNLNNNVTITELFTEIKNLYFFILINPSYRYLVTL